MDIKISEIPCGLRLSGCRGPKYSNFLTSLQAYELRPPVDVNITYSIASNLLIHSIILIQLAVSQPRELSVVLPGELGPDDRYQTRSFRRSFSIYQREQHNPLRRRRTNDALQVKMAHHDGSSELSTFSSYTDSEP